MAESTISEESLNALIVQVDVQHRRCSQLSASITTTNNVHVTENQPTNDPLSIDHGYPKTAAERMKEYRARKKKENRTVNYLKRKKSGAERVQECRARKKAKIQSANSTMAESENSEESSQALIVEVDGHHCSNLSASIATTSNVCVTENQPTSDLPSIDGGYPKTAAERMREYRARKNKENPMVNHRKPKKSDTELAQEYRARKNAKAQSADIKMESEAKVFTSNIIRVKEKLKNNLYDVINIVPATPLSAKSNKDGNCDFVPRSDKYYVSKKKNCAKVKTVRDIRNMFEKDVFSYLPAELEKQKSLLMCKIRGGSSKEEQTKQIAQNILNSDSPITRQVWHMIMNINPLDCKFSSQYVIWNGKIIQVGGSKAGKKKFITNYDIGKDKKCGLLKRPINKRTLISKRKGLLHNSLNVNFRPGPLTRKKYLDTSYQKYQFGDMELVNLPKPGLDVQPSLGKSLAPTINTLLQNTFSLDTDGKISKKWADFAVSVLGTVKNGTAAQMTEDCTITFDLNYKCLQNRILMRHDSDITNDFQDNVRISSVQIAEEESTVLTQVNIIMNDILNSVEISLKQDDLYFGEDEPREKSNTKNLILNCNSKDKPKRKCTELDRLDVTVIRIPDTLEVGKSNKCYNAFCALGCVCESLKCTFNLKRHCGRLECMFHCKCDFSKYKLLDSIDSDCSDIIPGLVNLDNKLALRLAKEEQKFHQTVIVTEEKSIHLKPQRRNWKTSKKYADFYSTMRLKAACSGTKMLSIPCVNLDCKDIEPWCMIHNLYKCFCRGKFTESFNHNTDEIKVLPNGYDNGPPSTSKRDVEEVQINDQIEDSIALLNVRSHLRSRVIHPDKTVKIACSSDSNYLNVPPTTYTINTCSRIKSYRGRKYDTLYYQNTNKKIFDLERNDTKIHKRLMDLISKDDKTKLPSTDMISKDDKTTLSTTSLISQDDKTKLPSIRPISNDDKTKLPLICLVSKGDKTKLPSTNMISKEDKTTLSTTSLISKDDKTKLPSTSLISKDEKTKLPSTRLISNDDKTKLPSIRLISKDDKTKLPSTNMISKDDKTTLSTTSLISKDDKTKLPSTSLKSKDEKTKLSSTRLISNDDKTKLPKIRLISKDDKTKPPSTSQDEQKPTDNPNITNPSSSLNELLSNVIENSTVEYSNLTPEKSNTILKPNEKRLPNKTKLVAWLETSYKQYKETPEKSLVKLSLDPPKSGKVALYPWEFILNRYREKKNYFLLTKQKPFRIFMAVDIKNSFFETCINISEIALSELDKYPITVKNLLTNASDLKDNFCILNGLSFCWELVGSVAKVHEKSDAMSNTDGNKDITKLILPFEKARSYNSSLDQLDSDNVETVDIDESDTEKNTMEDFRNPQHEENIELSKWFVMTIEADFTEIRFYNKGFFVKYDSVIKAINVARLSGKTVRLSSQKCNTVQSDPQFGIYAIPSKEDNCVFIGPYEENERLGIETDKTTVTRKKTNSTRGIWISTNKLDNLNVIDNPLLYMPSNSSKLDKIVSLDSDINSINHDTGMASIVHYDSDRVKKIIKPIKIRKSGFYQLSSQNLLKRVQLEQLETVSSNLQPIILNKPIIISPIKTASTSESCSSKISCDSNLLQEKNNESNKTTIVNKPIAEIAPQIKETSKVPLETRKRKYEGGMYILKPEEINQKSCENKLFLDHAQSSSQNSNLDPDQMNMDIEKFLATSLVCTLQNSDVYIISDDEDDSCTPTETWKKVWIVCKNIQDLGWIAGRKDNKNHLSFEFPGFKFTDFYSETQAYMKINQVLSRKVYVPKQVKLEWHFVESESDVKDLKKLDSKDLCADLVLTNKGLRHKFLLLEKFKNLNSNIGISNSSDECDSDEMVVKKKIRAMGALEETSSTMDEETSFLWNETILKKSEILKSFSKTSKHLWKELNDKLSDIILNAEDTD